MMEDNTRQPGQPPAGPPVPPPVPPAPPAAPPPAPPAPPEVPPAAPPAAPPIPPPHPPGPTRPLQPNGQPQETLPNSTAVLILGIGSLVAIFCCCSVASSFFGPLGIPFLLIGLAVGIIGLVLANKARNAYAADPGRYTESSYKNNHAGRICSIIGLISAAASMLLLLILVFALAGALASNPLFEEIFRSF